MSRNDTITCKTVTCESVAESLPWILNGTLDEAETAAVVAHVESCESCRRELQEAVEAAGLMTAHLPTLVIAEYALGLPTEFATEDIEAHLAACPSCRQELALVQMDAELDDAPAPGRVLEFKAPAASAEIRPARRSDWARWAAAAGLAAVIGSVAMVERPDPSVTDPSITEVVDHQSAPTEPAAVEILFADGFESGDLGNWIEET